MDTEQREDRQKQKKYQRYLRGELESAATYQALAAVEKDPARSDIFRKLADAEMRHAASWAAKMAIPSVGLRPKRTLRVHLMKPMSRVFGTQRVVPMLLRGEDKEKRGYASDPEAFAMAREEQSHGETLRTMPGNRGRWSFTRSEAKHFTGGGSLRAAVLGVNDGLTSNFALVMGVAGGSGNADIVLLAGVAGLLAGAFSMAAGEYVSMRSQSDVYEHQIEMERTELDQWPEEEEEQLALLYQAKGLPSDEARSIAARVMAHPQAALDTLVREELGLIPGSLGSPWKASGSSFVAFGLGALVPIAPYFLGAGELALGLSAVLSAGALLTVGGGLALLSNKSVVWGAARMAGLASAAAALTYLVGSLVGDLVLG